MQTTQLGPGDSATWPIYAGHPLDPRHDADAAIAADQRMHELEVDTLIELCEGEIELINDAMVNEALRIARGRFEREQRQAAEDAAAGRRGW